VTSFSFDLALVNQMFAHFKQAKPCRRGLNFCCETDFDVITAASPGSGAAII
jgi:hypothetical protein